ncbi:MAG: DUF1810 domain-containing protein [Oscillospiraceae bacterium]|nr:DUF1810 domain-containing protein [Oscillospiraceae bacterium]
MLDRFLDAQRGDYAAALAEVRRGRKTSHWMWYIFPQIAGLGQSSTARYYSIRDLEEAREYYAHPVLGQRLREISGALLDLRGSDPVAVFGGIDSMKLKSSMTLFAVAAPDDPLFQQVLDKYYGGEQDALTLRILGV